MKKIQKIVVLCLLVLCIQVCTTEKKDLEKSKKSTFKSFDVNFTNLNVDASKGKTLRFESGTTVIIPANAFVDAEGKAVKGDVQVNYREFHNVAEIIASGITMKYDSAGKQYDFETAGMFEIQGNQKDKPVFIAKDKKIQINLASYKEGSFNFYYLQEGKQKIAMNTPFITSAFAQDTRNFTTDTWQVLQTAQLPKANEERKRKLDSLNKLLPAEPIQPKPFDEKAMVFDFELNTEEFPELKEFEGIIWQYAGNDEASNPEKNQWIFNHQWSSIKLEEHNPEALQYKLVLNGGGKSYEAIVNPALKGKAYEEAKVAFEQKMNSYKKTLEEQAERLADIKAAKEYENKRANFMRSFEIQQFGIYNCDRIYQTEDTVMLTANFKVDNGSQEFDKATLYLVIGNNMITYYPNKAMIVEGFRCYANTSNKLIAVLSNDKVAVFTSQDFANMKNFRNGAEYTFNLKTVSEKINSVQSLNDLMAKI